MGEKLQGHPLLWGIIRRFLMAGAVSVTFGILYRWQNIKIDRLEFLLNAIITSATACSGFILASVSILVSLSNTPLMKKINSTDAKKRIAISIQRKFGCRACFNYSEYHYRDKHRRRTSCFSNRVLSLYGYHRVLFD